MSASNAPLVGSIYERKPQSRPSAPSAKTNLLNGFPTVQHRSKSAFARAREAQKKAGPSKPREVPTVQPAMNVETPRPGLPTFKPVKAESVDWRKQFEAENEKRVETMTDAEREEERIDILQKLGPDVGEILRKARDARERKEKQSENTTDGRDEIPLVRSRPTSPPRSPAPSADGRTSPSSPPRSALSRAGTRPSSRADRKIRFAELDPTDIHVYESAPPSPRKRALALPAPSSADGPTVSLGEWKGSLPSVTGKEADASGVDPSTITIGRLEEGTPEDIRRRFFPAAPVRDPSLEWIEGGPSSETASALRFDLTGTPIPPELSSTLPTHLGLHHHADGDRAGYTLEDIFLLSRSTVPAQRATMLGVLARIVRRLGKGRRRGSAEGIAELQGQAEAIRKRILAAGVEATGERGSLGARAVEVMWECIVGWDEEVIPIEDVELQAVRQADSSPSHSARRGEDVLSSLPLEYLLSRVKAAFSTAALHAETLTQFLAILYRLAQHTNVIANAIVSTDGLVANVVQRFLLTPIPPTDSSLPDPFALQLLKILASASRANASALLDPADALLRFVTTPPPSSPYALPLATALLTGTLHLYTVFASYGLYSHVATTASEHFFKIGKYVLSEECRSRQLREAWLALLEAWVICAQDPHRTTPGHEILWSQVMGWGWGEDILEMRARLTEDDAVVWTALWRAAAAWLEGAKINCVKGGEKERAAVVSAVQDGFQRGQEKNLVDVSGRALSTTIGQLAPAGVRALHLEDLPSLREIAEHSGRLAAAMRLWLACVSPQLPGPPESPPFLLPFGELSDLCAQITLHPIWESVLERESVLHGHAFCRSLSLLLLSYLHMSRRQPGTSIDLWMAQAFAIVCRLLPGDEEAARRIIGLVLDHITADFVNTHGWAVPSVIWEKGGLAVIKPFLTYSLTSREDDAYIGAAWMTPESISHSTTQRLPSASASSLGARREAALPLARDWMLAPLNSLLRSGESDAFKTLPSSWDASETEIVRATLLLAKVAREVLQLHGLRTFVMTREETVFSCMKVFMLEHGQQQSDSTGEVFRDRIVDQYMEELVAPYASGTSADSLLASASSNSTPTLEVVASRFLGSGTPFYQFYTDFVALYDAISFSHSLFARLLLPPISMQYAPDYRKFLWDDYGHVLRTIRTLLEAVLTGNLGEYLWPSESDAQVVSSYLRALVNGLPEGFPRFVAVHHIASNIWPDLANQTEEKACKLLQAVVDQGNVDIIREVVCYCQVREGTILVPPECFTQTGGWRASRLEFIKNTGGAAMAERLRGLLEA